MTPREIKDTVEGHEAEARRGRIFHASLAAALVNGLAAPGRLSSAVSARDLLPQSDLTALD